jgi:hypothetical protein
LGLAILDRRCFDAIRQELGTDMFLDRSVRSVMEIISGMLQEKDEIDPSKLLGRLENSDDLKTAVMHAIAKADITQDRAKALKDCIEYVRKENREEKMKTLMFQLKKAQDSNNDAEVKSLLDKINKIHKERVR